MNSLSKYTQIQRYKFQLLYKSSNVRLAALKFAAPYILFLLYSRVFDMGFAFIFIDMFALNSLLRKHSDTYKHVT